LPAQWLPNQHFGALTPIVTDARIKNSYLSGQTGAHSQARFIE
jgi:hypothetical protein